MGTVVSAAATQQEGPGLNPTIQLLQGVPHLSPPASCNPSVMQKKT